MKIIEKAWIVNEEEKIIYSGVMFFDRLFGFRNLFGKRVTAEYIRKLKKESKK